MRSGGLESGAHRGRHHGSGRHGGFARLLSTGLVIPVALALAAGCTLLVDRDADQCSADGDCGAFPGTTCVEGVCSAVVDECQSTAECMQKLGDFHICRKSDHTCQALQSSLCTTVDGDYTSDAAIIFGAVGPTSGGDALTGRTIENSVKLAIDDFETAANGLPPAPGTSTRRPLVVVGCDDTSDSNTAVAAAQHLVGTVGVPAIIGAAFSGITLQMATAVTIPGGVLTISPSATSVVLTDLQDHDLVWRTSPSDVLQAAAVKEYVPFLEQQVRTELALTPADKVTLLVFNKGDAYGAGLAEALEPILEVNGANALAPSNSGFYGRFAYGNPDDPTNDPPKYAEARLAALAGKPHIILVFGTTEAVTEIFAPVEQQWDSSQPPVTHKPHWLFSDGGLVPDLWDTVVTTNDALRRRVTGTVPGTTDLLFQSYKQNYTTKYGGDGTSPDVFGGAGAYDATYLIAYSVAALAGQPVTGTSLAAVLAAGRMGSDTPPPDVVNVGKSGINGAFQRLSAGQSIDFQGASGPLDFDLTTGEAQSDIQIWCMSTDITGHAEAGISSGIYYSASSASLVGVDYGPQCEF